MFAKTSVLCRSLRHSNSPPPPALVRPRWPTQTCFEPELSSRLRACAEASPPPPPGDHGHTGAGTKLCVPHADINASEAPCTQREPMGAAWTLATRRLLARTRLRHTAHGV